VEKHFYVYYSYEQWGRGYIGRRECRCLPEDDSAYFGSFKDKTFRPTQKIVLQVCSSREEACEAEVLLHGFFEVDINPHFANKAKQTSKKFCKNQEGKNNGHYGKRRKRSLEEIEKQKEFYRKHGHPTKGKPALWTEERKENYPRGEAHHCYRKPGHNRGMTWKKTPEKCVNHVLAALNRPLLECPICGKKCKGAGPLKMHQRSHKEFQEGNEKI
jgi:hypothetical protein